MAGSGCLRELDRNYCSISVSPDSFPSAASRVKAIQSLEVHYKKVGVVLNGLSSWDRCLTAFHIHIVILVSYASTCMEFTSRVSCR